MNIPTVGYRSGGDQVLAAVRNDAGASIPKGTPVLLSLDGTEDGLAVILLSGAGSQAEADKFFYGVVSDTLVDGAIGNVQLFGVAREAVVLRATRGGSATSDNWAGSTSIASGLLLTLDTANNCFATAADTLAQTNSSQAPLRQPFAFLAASINSFASTDSVATSNGSALTVLAKVFVRAL